MGKDEEKMSNLKATKYPFAEINEALNNFCPLCEKQVIAGALGQLTINFPCIFKVCQIL